MEIRDMSTIRDDLVEVNNIICEYFGLPCFEALHERNRNGLFMWTVRFICLFSTVLLDLTFDEVGLSLRRDRITVRWHLIKICTFIKVQDDIVLDLYNDLLILFKDNGYDTSKVRDFVNNFDENDYKRGSYRDRKKKIPMGQKRLIKS